MKKGACRAGRAKNQQEQALSRKKMTKQECKHTGKETSTAYAIGEQVLYQRLSQSVPDTQTVTQTLFLSRLILAII